MIELKNEEQFALMREAGLIVRGALETLRGEVKDGVTTARLDALAEDYIRSHEAVPSFKGYGHPPFPGVICASLNHEIVHGIPGKTVVHDGDIISIDCGAIFQGWHGDAAITVGVGAISAADAALLEACETALWHGLAQARAGRPTATSHTRWRPAPAGPAGTAWSRSTPATASAARCTWTRRCPTTAGRGAARGCGRAWRWPSSRW